MLGLKKGPKVPYLKCRKIFGTRSSCTKNLSVFQVKLESGKVNKQQFLIRFYWPRTHNPPTTPLEKTTPLPSEYFDFTNCLCTKIYKVFTWIWWYVQEEFTALLCSQVKIGAYSAYNSAVKNERPTTSVDSDRPWSSRRKKLSSINIFLPPSAAATKSCVFNGFDRMCAQAP